MTSQETIREDLRTKITKKHGWTNHYYDGQLHREGDLPATYWTNESERHLYAQAWYKHGKLHREGDLPAIITSSDNIWYKDGYRHRTLGPAYMSKTSGLTGWYLKGVPVPAEHVFKLMHKQGVPIQEFLFSESEEIRCGAAKVLQKDCIPDVSEDVQLLIDTHLKYDPNYQLEVMIIPTDLEDSKKLIKKIQKDGFYCFYSSSPFDIPMESRLKVKAPVSYIEGVLRKDRLIDKIEL